MASPLRAGMLVLGTLGVPLGLLGCPQSSTYGQATGQSRRATTGSGVGGTSGSAGGSTTGGASSGSSGGAPDGGDGGCSNTITQLADCPAGQVEVAATLVNICDCQTPPCQPLSGNYQVLDHDSAAVGNVVACGGMYFCLDAGTPLTIEVPQGAYAPSLLETVTAGSSIYFDELPILCTGAYSLLELLPNSGFDPSREAFVGVLVQPAYSNPVCTSTDRSGWSFTLTDVDGGPLDAGIGPIYFTTFSTLPSQNATETASSGLAVFLIPEPPATVRIQGSSVDSGCAPMPALFDMNNQIELAIGYATIVPFVIAPTDAG